MQQFKADAKLKKSATKVINLLQPLKESLVVTTGDSYVGEAEPELREKLSDLYAEVANQFEKPSLSQLENKEVLETRLQKAKKDFEKIKNKEISKFEKR